MECGPHDGAVVILLHGFPDLWWSWKHQPPAPAANGLWVVPWNQRRYGRSDEPRKLRAFDLDQPTTSSNSHAAVAEADFT